MALGGTAPQMAQHAAADFGADGQGLFERLGSLSMGELRAQGYEPMAITSLLAKIGTSDSRGPAPALTSWRGIRLPARSAGPARFDEGRILHVDWNAAISCMACPLMT